MIGLHGRMGSGKDTVLERLQVLQPGRFERVSFADPLKRSAAALLGVSVEKLEEWKRDEEALLCFGNAENFDAGCMTVRKYLQRYGTEAHRDIFGSDFWVNIGISKAAEMYSRGVIEFGRWASFL